MKRFDLYGSQTMSVEAVARSLEKSLFERFVEHESSYRGLYFRAGTETEEVLVQANAKDDDGYLPEPRFGSWPTLVYVNGSHRWPDVERACADVPLSLLRSETV